MEFLFEWLTWAQRTSEISSLVHIYKRQCIILFYTYEDFFDDFLKISESFPNISEDSPKAVRRPDNRFIILEHFQKSPRIVEEFQR